MLFTLAICTWNRCSELQRLLDNLVSCAHPNDVDWEVIVIDNNSCDSTHSVVDEFSKKLPIKYFLERKQGLSHARNRALSETNSEWLIFTDDDVEVPADWLINYVKELKNIPCNIAFVGGEVEAKFLFEPPTGMIEAIPIVSDGFCGVTIPKKREIDELQDKIPFGANFALRISSLDGNVFNTELGVSGETRLMGEETAFMKQLLKERKRGMWFDGVGLLHLVDSGRLSDKYIKAYLFGMGRSIVLWSPHPKEFKFPKWAYRAIVEDLITIAKCRLTSRQNCFERYTAIKRCYQLGGMLSQVLRIKLRRWKPNE